MQSVLVTGAAGFIGFHVSQALMNLGHQVIGIDNLNDYYDPALKGHRLELLQRHKAFQFEKVDIASSEHLDHIFSRYQFDAVVHLAAQAGVRYSIDNPNVYVQSNLLGFANVLECVRAKPVQHLVYASTSSIYGNNQKVPFAETDQTDHPVSFYAATKKANEVMAYSYSNLYQIPTTALRFFTVYGPWGRPDMALFKFTQKILAGEPIEVFNHGELYRDFTYIDDIVGGIVKTLASPPQHAIPYEIYNIGCGAPIKLEDFILELEQALGQSAHKIYVPMQAGDVFKTYADIRKLKNDFAYQAQVSVHEGVKKFVEWYKKYYKTEGAGE